MSIDVEIYELNTCFTHHDQGTCVMSILRWTVNLNTCTNQRKLPWSPVP